MMHKRKCKIYLLLQNEENGNVLLRKKSKNNSCFISCILFTQPAFTYSKLTIETLEQGVEYVRS